MSDEPPNPPPARAGGLNPARPVRGGPKAVLPGGPPSRAPAGRGPPPKAKDRAEVDPSPETKSGPAPGKTPLTGASTVVSDHAAGATRNAAPASPTPPAASTSRRRFDRSAGNASTPSKAAATTAAAITSGCSQDR